MQRHDFLKAATSALEDLERRLGALEHEALDVDLAGDVLTLGFSDGTKFVINAHSAASQIWMAADRTAWHFDLMEDTGRWIASKTGDELRQAVARVVGGKLGCDLAGLV